MEAAREAGATPGELRNAIRIAEKVRQVQRKKAEKFAAKISNLLEELKE